MEFVIYVLLTVLYLAGLLCYLFVAPFIALGRSAGLVGVLTAGQGRVARGVLRRRTPEFQLIAPYRPDDEEQPAYRQYFYGPAQRDLRQIWTLVWRRFHRQVVDAFRATRFRYFTEPTGSRLFSVPFGLTLCLGLAVGVLIDIPLLALALGLYALGITTAQGLARATGGTLRGLDAAVLRVKDLHKGMICPHCYEPVRYPYYRCPGAACPRLHTDIRQARYGILRRRCACGTRLPTLIMTGAHRLQAVCPFCEQPMSEDTGRVPETVLPMIGGIAAGKTQLMAAMLMALGEEAARGGPAMSLADPDTRQRYAYLREVLNLQGHVVSTQRSLPHSYSLLLNTGRKQRLVHIFDAAGERFTDRESADALRYAEAARTFVFVLDPLAVPAFWNGLAPEQQTLLDRSLASRVDPALVFQQTVRTLLGMGSVLSQSRLAVAVSKTDLLAGSGLVEGLDQTEGDEVAEWLDHALGLGNLVRLMRMEFREVRFFRTAAVTNEDARVDSSITRLVDWCLRN